MVAASTHIGLIHLVDANGGSPLGDVSYLEFLLPGLLAAAVMQTAYLEAAGPVHEAARDDGSYRSAAATTLDPSDVFDGHLLFIGLRVMLSASMFTSVSAAFGAIGPARVVTLVLCGTLVGLAFAAPVAAWAVTVRRSASLSSAYRFVVMPLYMFSGAFFPVEQLSSAIRYVAWATPLWHGVELCRSVALDTATPARTLLHVGCLVALTALGVWLARRAYRRKLHF